jgi:branched-chain amino acid transport system substrate-binding protein
MARRLAAPVAVLAAVSLLGIPGAGAQQNPPVNQPGVTSSEIRVGGVATVTNDPTNGHNGDAFAGTQAYFDYINSTGGLYGRKLVLSSKRDDMLANNRTEVQGLISQDNVFSVLPVATSLFSGADLLSQAGIPTFGWLQNPEFGSESNNPGPPNFFGHVGSFLNLSSAWPSPMVWLAKKLNLKRVGVIAYNVPQSTACASSLQKSFSKYNTAKVVFVDQSLSYGNVDYSTQVAKMVQDKVDYVLTCIDANGVVSLTREMKKQGLNAAQMLPNAYNQAFVGTNSQFLNGVYVFTTFTPFEVQPKPPGLMLYEKWIKKSGGPQDELSMYGWLNADLFVTGLKAAGPNFTRQNLVSAINKMTNYTAGGLLPPVNWTTAHTQQTDCFALVKVVGGKFKPVFGQPGKPFLCFPPTLTTIPANPATG